MAAQSLSAVSDTPVVETSAREAFISFAQTITPDTYHDAPSFVDYSLSEPEMFSTESSSLGPQRSSTTSRKKSPNHIPRPPNAFILFRSAFIKSQRVTSGVETNHSTLSKIIGLTWQQLSHEERQKWHAKAKIAQEEHKKRYPMYSFRPVHNRRGGGGGHGGSPYHTEKRKLREISPKDEKRCEKIAELLACGKKGQELEEAIKEFDKHHVPKIVTRFEDPITAESFGSSASGPAERWPSPAVSSRSCSSGSGYGERRRRRSATPSSQGRPNTSQSGITYLSPPSPALEVEAHAIDPLVPRMMATANATNPLSFDVHSFFPSPSFEIDNFDFSVQESSLASSNRLAPVIDTHFDSSLVPIAGPSLSVCSGNTTYAHHVHVQEHSRWPGARSCSPLSTNSTGSLPATPISLSYAEQSSGLGSISVSGSGYDAQNANQASYNSFGTPGPDASHSHAQEYSQEYEYATLSANSSRRNSNNCHSDLNDAPFVPNYGPPQAYQVQSYTPQLSLPMSMSMSLRDSVSVPDFTSKQLDDSNDVYAASLESSELTGSHVQVRRDSYHGPEHNREDMELAMFMASFPSSYPL